MNSKNKFLLIVVLIFFLLPLFSQGAQEMHAIFEGTKSDDVEMVLKSIYFLDKEVARIDAEHDLLWEEKQGEIEYSFLPQFQAVDMGTPEIWETDAEFEQRSEREKLHLQKEVDKEVQAAETIALEMRNSAKQPFEDWIAIAHDTLATSRILPAEQVTMEPLEYQRNERLWPIVYQSRHALVQFENITIRFDFEYLHPDDPEEMKQSIIDMDNALKTGNLSTVFYWKVYKQETNRFITGIYYITLKDLLSGRSYFLDYKELMFKNTYEVVGDTYAGASIQRVF